MLLRSLPARNRRARPIPASRRCPANPGSYALALLAVCLPVPESIRQHLRDSAEISVKVGSCARDGHNRRVRNDRIKQELGVVLQYPTYREGLRALA